jgi:hypothetical protein
MTIEEHIERMEFKLRGLAKVQDEMMDLLGLTMEGERRLATRMERSEEFRLRHEEKMVEIDAQTVEIKRTLTEIGHKLAETDDKLNALIGVVDGFIRGKN